MSRTVIYVCANFNCEEYSKEKIVELIELAPNLLDLPNPVCVVCNCTPMIAKLVTASIYDTTGSG